MRIITRKFLEASKVTYPKARAPLDHWHRFTCAAKWQNLVQTRQSFPMPTKSRLKAAGPSRFLTSPTIFVSSPPFTTIARRVFTLRFLTHADYDKDTWKNTL
jgi:mRNA interferase HigB